MAVKNDVYEILLTHINQYVSGASIAQDLNVSRNAVWKAILQLKKEGCMIEAVPNKGYLLTKIPDDLRESDVRRHLNPQIQNIPIQILSTTDSTNTDAKKAALNGAQNHSVFLAKEQTAGKGRLGRRFFSPKSGIYVSVIFQPQNPLSEPGLVTTATAVAVCRAIEEAVHIKTSIKWVNDIFFNQKKVCGILCEAITDMESGQISRVITGIGINFMHPENGYPEELKDIAGALFSTQATCTRSKLTAILLNHLIPTIDQLNPNDFIPEYKKRMFLLGQTIEYQQNGQTQTAKAMDIDVQGGLVVKTEDNKLVTLKTGEVSIKKHP